MKTQAPPAAFAPPRILLVEDSPGDARLVLEMLGGAWASIPEVAHVENLDEAQRFLLKTTPGCVLLDLSLPDGDGVQTVVRIRAAAADVPIIVLTGLDDERLAVEAVQEGAQDYLIKGRVDGNLLGRSIRYAVERKRIESRLAHQAAHDPLTGLPNRELLLDHLTLALARSERRRTAVAILFLDLDRFKVINDSLGHDAGDELLRAVTARILQVLRPTDIVARFGGDEFVVLCEDIAEERDATMIAERIAESLTLPFELDEGEVFVSTSVGIAMARGAHDGPMRLLRDADAAMYRAKEHGRARFEVFDDEMRLRAVERLEMENALRRAMARQEFRLLYQPIVRLPEGRVVGAEALLRWEHPERGLLSPSEFIPLAEETGLIVPIGTWVLQEASRQMERWRTEIPDTPPLTMAVNLSGRQLSQPDLADIVAGALAQGGADPASFHLEITESSVMEDAELAVAALRSLRALGVRLSIDDFGVGYSSLVYLRRFPVDLLKIDRSFVDGLGHDAEDSAIVAAVISLAHALGLSVVAEGLEQERQLRQLRRLGCDFAQGYHFAHPAPADAIPELLLSRAAAESSRAR